ncbi:MAG: hypothetical protein R2748_02105 [Bryobacterales bacterium]
MSKKDLNSNEGISRRAVLAGLGALTVAPTLTQDSKSLRGSLQVVSTSTRFEC